MNDLRFAFRQLLKNPGFTAVAVLTLALGIMATRAMYSVIYAVVLDPFPYKDVDNLMSVKVWDPAQQGYRTDYSTDQFIVKRGSRLLLAGIALGLTGGLFAARLLSRQIWNVSPFDPITFSGVSVILLLAGLLACLWPARRAARIEPMEALRYE